MPATVLAVVQAASWSRYLRGSMIETLDAAVHRWRRGRAASRLARVILACTRCGNALGPVHRQS